MKTIVLDIETTGLPPAKAEYKTDYMYYPYIVSFAYKINEGETREYIINQEARLIPKETTEIHGITNEMCDASPWNLASVLGNFAFEVEGSDLIIGHGIYFDTSVIKANILRLIELGTMKQLFYDRMENILHKDKRVDTMMKTIKFCGLGKWAKLSELHFKLFGTWPEESHKAGKDVETCYKCYVELKRLGVL